MLSSLLVKRKVQILFAFHLFYQQANRVESELVSEFRQEGIDLRMRLRGGVTRQSRPCYHRRQWRHLRVRQRPRPLPLHPSLPFR
jgi:hypothetical protein